MNSFYLQHWPPLRPEGSQLQVSSANGQHDNTSKYRANFASHSHDDQGIEQIRQKSTCCKQAMNQKPKTDNDGSGWKKLTFAKRLLMLLVRWERSKSLRALPDGRLGRLTKDEWTGLLDFQQRNITRRWFESTRDQKRPECAKRERRIMDVLILFFTFYSTK